MKSDLKIGSLILLFVLGSVAPGHAQFPGPKLPANRSYLKFFEEHKAFSAQGEVKIQDASDKETMTMLMSFAVLDGKTRTEMDLTRMKSADMPAQAVASMKQFGMDQMINLVHSDKQMSYLIYPSLKAYAEIPLKDEAGPVPSPGNEPKIEKTELGKETIDGHPCVKSKVIITDNDGKTHEGLIWAATDLKNFPIQLQMKEKGSTVTTRYRNVQFAKPDPKLFVPPAGFTKYGSVQEMMQTAVGRLMRPPGNP